jgi:hypothetical protein
MKKKPKVKQIAFCKVWSNISSFKPKMGFVLRARPPQTAGVRHADTQISVNCDCILDNIFYSHLSIFVLSL